MCEPSESNTILSNTASYTSGSTFNGLISYHDGLRQVYGFIDLTWLFINEQTLKCQFYQTAINYRLK